METNERYNLYETEKIYLEKIIENSNNYIQGCLVGTIFNVLITMNMGYFTLIKNENSVISLSADYIVLYRNFQSIDGFLYQENSDKKGNPGALCSLSYLSLGDRYAICHVRGIDKKEEQQIATIISSDHLNEFIDERLLKLEVKKDRTAFAKLPEIINNDHALKIFCLDSQESFQEYIKKQHKENHKNNGANYEDNQKIFNEFIKNDINFNFLKSRKLNNIKNFIATTMTSILLISAIIFATISSMPLLATLLIALLASVTSFFAVKSYYGYKFYDQQLKQEHTFSFVNNAH